MDIIKLVVSAFSVRTTVVVIGFNTSIALDVLCFWVIDDITTARTLEPAINQRQMLAPSVALCVATHAVHFINLVQPLFRDE